MANDAALGVGDGLVQVMLGYVLTIVVAFATAGLIWLVVRTLGAMERRQAAAAPVPAVVVTAIPAADEINREVAVVAAAVHAALGTIRIVHIGEVAAGGAWRTTGRTLHQSSHRPRP